MSDVDTQLLDELEADLEKVQETGQVEYTKTVVDGIPVFSGFQSDPEPRTEAERKLQKAMSTGRRMTPEEQARSLPGEYKAAEEFQGFGDFLRQGLADQDSFKAEGGAYSKAYNSLAKHATVNTSKFEDGGALVLPEFSSEIMAMLYGGDTNESMSLWDRTQQYTVRGNSMTFPKLRDNDERDGRRHGGVLAAFEEECKEGESSVPKFDSFEVKLNKLFLFICFTEEMVEDSSYPIEQFLRQVARAEIQYVLDRSLVCGKGVGTPQGFLESGAKVVVEPEEGQTPDSLLFENIVNMFACKADQNLDGWFWLMCPDTYAKLLCLSKAVGSAGGQLVFLPGGNLSGQPFGTLLGMPILINKFAPPMGCEGDIALVNLSKYVTVSKGTINEFASPHVHFYSGKNCLRFSMRTGGGPCENKPTRWEKCGDKLRSDIILLGDRKAA